MIEKLQESIEKLNKREKIIMLATGIALLFYVAYSVVFQSVYTKINKNFKELQEVKKEHNSLKAKSGRLKQLGEIMKQYKNNLKKAEQEEKSFKKSLRAENQISNFLQKLHSTAEGLPMQLVNLSTKTNVITKTGKSKVEAKTTDKAGSGGAKTVRISYTQNVIELTYRSDYYSSVDFITKILELPYTVSIKSVLMSTSKESDDDENSGSTTLSTKLVLEIFFK